LNGNNAVFRRRKAHSRSVAALIFVPLVPDVTGISSIT
jgi:hypothetical protein